MESRFYFIHAFVGQTKGRATVVIEAAPSAKNVFASVAWCSPKDQFNRKMGRRIALGRLKHSQKRLFLGSYDPEKPLMRETLIELLKQVAHTEELKGTTPRWAKKAPLLFKKEDSMDKYGVVLNDTAKDQTKCACGQTLDEGKACPTHGTEPLETVAVPVSKTVADAIRGQSSSVSMGCSTAEAPCQDCNNKE